MASDRRRAGANGADSADDDPEVAQQFTASAPTATGAPVARASRPGRKDTSASRLSGRRRGVCGAQIAVRPRPENEPPRKRDETRDGRNSRRCRPAARKPHQVQPSSHFRGSRRRATRHDHARRCVSGGGLAQSRTPRRRGKPGGTSPIPSSEAPVTPPPAGHRPGRKSGEKRSSDGPTPPPPAPP